MNPLFKEYLLAVMERMGAKHGSQLTDKYKACTAYKNLVRDGHDRYLNNNAKYAQLVGRGTDAKVVYKPGYKNRRDTILATEAKALIAGLRLTDDKDKATYYSRATATTFSRLITALVVLQLFTLLGGLINEGRGSAHRCLDGRLNYCGDAIVDLPWGCFIPLMVIAVIFTYRWIRGSDK